MKSINHKRSVIFSLPILLSLISSFCSYSQSCDTWVALGNSTKDGSVIMGKNSDRPSVEAQPLVYHPRQNHKMSEKVMCTHIEIPQVQETYAHIGSKIWWTFGYEQFKMKTLTCQWHLLILLILGAI